MDCIEDVRVMDTDQPSYTKRNPERIIAQQEREEQKKYLQVCLEQRHHFTPFAVSIDGMLGKEARTFNKRIATTSVVKYVLYL